MYTVMCYYMLLINFSEHVSSGSRRVSVVGSWHFDMIAAVGLGTGVHAESSRWRGGSTHPQQLNFMVCALLFQNSRSDGPAFAA